jgi:hypothetical protein
VPLYRKYYDWELEVKEYTSKAIAILTERFGVTIRDNTGKKINYLSPRIIEEWWDDFG